MEEKILEFWKKNKIFEKSLEKKSPKGEYVFYDGPVTSNAPPVFHTMEPFSFKDAIPRYKTMRGYHVRRKGGWDTHGLPVELQIEKKLGLKSKKEIESFGIAEFNKLCKESVWEYIGLWKDFAGRIGYWADQDNAYITYHNDYIESVWNVIKEADKQKLLYKDYKVVPWCPRCGTALSSHELAQGYEDVKDLSVYVKFRISPDQKNFAALPASGLRHGLNFSNPASYFLAWTTTPWTLPGNVALAVGKDITYVEAKVGEEIFVLAKDRLSILQNYKIVAEHKGKEMVGMQYEPLYPYLKNQNPQNIENAYKVYAADFVSTQEGTGIVHTAVMYGQDDFELGTKVGLPKFHLVNPEGNFIVGTDWLAGRSVVDETLAVDILKDLQSRNSLFAKENYTHSYPFCWRCKTRLIYYARDSWYIRMSEPKIKKKLISENKKINWEPEHIRKGRFGEWLRDVKDWAISRERYWGTPLPVWACERCGEKFVIGSLAELKQKIKKSGNKYLVARHGEATSNVKQTISCKVDEKNKLTEKGIQEIKSSIKKYKNVDFIFSSPMLRTRDTAIIIADSLGFNKNKIIFDERLWEINEGDLDGANIEESLKYTESMADYFETPFPKGESRLSLHKRMGDFLYELEKNYSNQKILIISHGDPIMALALVAKGCIKEKIREEEKDFKYFKTGEIREFDFTPLPHNENYELDFHRPYIDAVVLACKCGGIMRRTKEVMDVWLDSGAMPFAQDHYPFDFAQGKPLAQKKLLYPADYICEAIDQTRGWFYTLHAVGVLMGRGRAYENVICLGHLLDREGKKMSKSLGNVVDPWEMIEKYGADALRLWMYSVNQPGESKNFDEKTVQLLRQQVFGLFYNVLAFYELYRDKGLEKSEPPNSKNVLDTWVLSRLNELIELTTKSLDNYKLMEPTRAIRDFINDLSTWYLRRSRERIKNETANPAHADGARATLYFVLKTLAKVVAPFAPFAAEDIWLKLRNGKDEESVHLEDWPAFVKTSARQAQVLKDMVNVREIVTKGLEARQKAGIPVRQPLAQFKIKNSKLKIEYLDLIKDELNVKEISAGKEFRLITELTPELKEEGNYRELLRAIQDLRKKAGLKPSDVVSLSVETDEKGKNLIQKFESDLKKVAQISKIDFRENNGLEIKINRLTFKIKF